MSKSEFAQAYTERMFPDIAAPAGYIDPEFEVLFDNFAFDEVITEEGRNVPVSYTHLDVYKRQVLFSLQLSFVVEHLDI